MKGGEGRGGRGGARGREGSVVLDTREEVGGV